MEQIEDKIIIAQVKLTIDFLGSFIQELASSPDKSINKFFDDWHKKIGRNNDNERYYLLNQGLILTSLYGLIVYPKEKFYLKIPEIEISSLNKDDWGIMEIKKCHETNPNLRYIVRRIRNSLSHSRVSIDESLNFTFEDINRDNVLDFRIVMNIRELEKFIFKFNKGIIKETWN